MLIIEHKGHRINNYTNMGSNHNVAKIVNIIQRMRLKCCSDKKLPQSSTDHTILLSKWRLEIGLHMLREMDYMGAPQDRILKKRSCLSSWVKSLDLQVSQVEVYDDQLKT